jgi:tetratricopeptide (TPR) repeat protein
MIRKLSIMIFGLIFLISVTNLALGGTVILKSGRQVKGNITERADDYVKIEIQGVTLMFLKDEIHDIRESESDAVRVSDVRYAEDGTYLEEEGLEASISALLDFFIDKNYKDASILLEGIISTYPDFPDMQQLYTAEAIAHYYLGDMDKAAVCFKQAVDYDPDNADTYFYSGLSYYSSGKFNEAKSNFIQARHLYLQNKEICEMFVIEVLLKNLEEE